MFVWNWATSHCVFTKSWLVLHLVRSAANPPHMLLSIWMMGLCGAANPLETPWTFFFLASFYVSCNQICGRGSSSQPHRAERLLLCWRRSPLTQSMKSVDSRSQGPACWALQSSTRPGENGTAQSAGEGHWSDEKIIPTLPPPSVAGPHAASNHLWAVTWPDWAERIWVGNFKTCSCFCVRERICITHSDLMDFPMFAPDSPFFCWHVQIMNLLCVGSLYSPSCSWVQFLVAR